SAEEVRDLQNFSFIILRDGTRVTWQHWNSPDSPHIYHFKPEVSPTKTVKAKRARRISKK
ncbi:hypothetical protein L0128_21915, partial [candidate division KSB1 bacterium]|nr:hypothetical protein [candidate division KSB1 bacterium]